jgi:hypothetical protein
MADGYGPAIAKQPVGDGMRVLRVARDDVPIQGRQIEIQGQPVTGAMIQLVGILWHPSPKLDALKAEKVAYPVQYRMLR